MKIKEILMYALGGLVVAGFFFLMYLLVFNMIPENNKDTLNLVVGALIGSFTTWFGCCCLSSNGSADKTAIMNEKLNGA